MNYWNSLKAAIGGDSLVSRAETLPGYFLVALGDSPYHLHTSSLLFEPHLILHFSSSLHISANGDSCSPYIAEML